MNKAKIKNNNTDNRADSLAFFQSTDAVEPLHSSVANRLALPPDAAVLIVTTCSVAKRRR